MPAVPLQQPQADTTHIHQHETTKTPSGPQPYSEATLAPAPAVIDVSSHVERHAQPRRFLGLVPQSIATGDQAVAKRERIRTMRRNAMQSLLKTDGLLGIEQNGGQMVRQQAARAVHTFRVHKKDRLNNEHQTQVDINESDSDTTSSSSDDEPSTWFSPTRKKKHQRIRKINLSTTKWVGTSFDIGREFETPDEKPHGSDNNSRSPSPTRGDLTSAPLQDSPEQDARAAEATEPSSPTPKGKGKGKGKSKALLTVDADARTFKTAQTHLTPEYNTTPTRSRPTSTRSTTQDTFVTAKMAEDGGEDKDDFYFTPHTPIRSSNNVHTAPSEASPSSHVDAGHSPTSSMAPLITSDDDPGKDVKRKRAPSRASTRGSLSRLSVSLSSASKRNFPHRLKSALRVSGANFEAAPDALPESPAKPRGKTVQFSPALPKPPIREDTVDIVRKGDKAPVDPKSVLTRTGIEVAGASAGDHEPAVVDTDDFMPGGVVMRDRVLVKLGRHRDEGITSFDEMTQRRRPCIRFDPMEEYIVGMTTVSIDFYKDWPLAIQEKWEGTKRLAFSVPLAPPTTISVFNQRDMSLSLICPWSSVMRQTVRHLSRSRRAGWRMWDSVRTSKTIEALGMEHVGSAIFVIKFGERTRALDWHWYISGQLDYTLPVQIDIQVPALSQTIRMPIPEEAASSTVNRNDTLKTVWGAVVDNTTFTDIIRDLGHIPRPELAWKGPDATLDWVAYSTTVTGKNREWALLASFAQHKRTGKTSNLQIRDANHYPQRLHLEDDVELEEPLGVEGYLTRHKTDVSPKEMVYISTMEGAIFVSNAQVAIPPLLPKRRGSTPADVFPAVYDEFRRSEKRRMAKFIQQCAGCLDFHDIISVSFPTPKGEEASAAAPPDTSTVTTHVHPMSTSHPVRTVGKRGQREFEVRLRSGQTVRFEAHTPVIAHEWVERLNALAQYWTLRRRVDAREHMDVVKEHTGSEAFVGRNLDRRAEAILNSIWNWCVIDGCRPITMCGQVFIKRGKFRKFKLCFIVLTAGSIVTFRLKSASGMQARSRLWPLFGAYIYSGKLAQDELLESSNEAAFTPSARIYDDGLQATDGAEDTGFCIRITWPAGRWAPVQPWDKDSEDEDDGEDFTSPPLKEDPGTLLICRARSKLERDRWVWGLNSEKERLARAHVHQEEKLRNSGELPRHSTIQHIDGSVDARPSFRRHGSRASSRSSRS